MPEFALPLGDCFPREPPISSRSLTFFLAEPKRAVEGREAPSALGTGGRIATDFDIILFSTRFTLEFFTKRHETTQTRHKESHGHKYRVKVRVSMTRHYKRRNGQAAYLGRYAGQGNAAQALLRVANLLRDAHHIPHGRREGQPLCVVGVE